MKVRERKDILLADDSEFFRINISNILASVGHRVSLAKDGDEVIKDLENKLLDFDLLILDLKMPRLDGFSVLEWMRRNNRVGSPPVLVVTGAYETTAVLDKVKSLGAVGFIKKGTSPEQIIYRVNTVLYPEKIQKANPRVPTNIPVDFTFTDRTYHTGYILNISDTGVFIYSNELLEPGDSTSLRFSLEGDDRVIEAEGKVIWVNNLSGKEALFNGMGVHFTRITSENRKLIATFVRKALNTIQTY